MKTRTITLHHDEQLIVTIPQGTITINVTGKTFDSVFVTAHAQTRTTDYTIRAAGKNLLIEPTK